MIWYFYILWSNHYNKRSYHSSPYKAVTIYLTPCMLHSSICITRFHLCPYTSSLWARFMCPYIRSVSLPQFLSHHNKNLERWKGFRTTKKLQLRYFIRQSLPRHRRMPTPKESSSLPSWRPPPTFILLISSFGCALCKIRLLSTTSQWRGMQMGLCSRLIGNYKLYNSRLCCLCLPIIQSVIIRYIYVCVCVYIYIYEIFMNSWWVLGLPWWLRR